MFSAPLGASAALRAARPRAPLRAIPDHDAAPLGPIFESAIDELAAHVATERMSFAFGGMASDQAAAMLGGRDMASLAPADARHITMLAVNQIAHHQLHPDQPLPPLTPLYLAPAFLGPKKNAE